MVASVSQFKKVTSAHQRLRAEVNEMIRLAHSHDVDALVYPVFIERIVSILGAQAGFLWNFDEQGDLICRQQHHSSSCEVDSLNMFRPDKGMLVDQASTEKGGILNIQARSKHGDEKSANAVRPIWVVPVHRQGLPWGVIEVIPHRISSQKNLMHGLQILRHFSNVLTHRVTLQASRASARKLSDKRAASHNLSAPAISPSKKSKPTEQRQQKTTNNQRGDHLKKVALSFHESLELEPTAMIIVNELRRVLVCDRVSLLLTNGVRWQVLAISGQEVINHRADAVCQLCAIADAAKEHPVARWFQYEGNPVSSGIFERLKGFYRSKSWNEVGVIPVPINDESANSSACHALLLVEYQSQKRKDMAERELLMLLPDAAAALRNALNHNQILLLKLWKTLGRFKQSVMSSSRRKIATVAGLFIFVAVLLVCFPTDFYIHGQGHLQPVKQKDVFADVQGVVTEVHVHHGDKVQKGDVILEMRNTDLDIAIAEILGKRRSAEEQLSSIQRLRHTDNISQAEETRLAGQTFQLQEQLKGLRQQLILLQEKKKRLVVRSPLSGQVTSWNVHRTLLHRPVIPGQVLVTIADQSGPWNLEVYLPESEVGHLLALDGNSEKQSQEVEFLVASQPTITHAGVLTEVDSHAQLYEEFGHAVRARIELDKESAPAAPAGTTVTAHINCGQRSIGYVWFHRLADFVHTRILFPLF